MVDPKYEFDLLQPQGDDLDQGDKADRQGFIRKVYGILSVQLFFTALSIGVVQMDPALRLQMQSYYYTALAMFIFSSILQLALIWRRDLARRVPVNYIMLALFTMCQAFYFSHVTSFFGASETMMAGFMTFGMTLGITAYAMMTSRDMTLCGSFTVTSVIGIIMFCFISMFMSTFEWWHPVLCTILCVVYGMYLIYDTQLIAGGHSLALSYDEYIVGASLLYVDIMMLFIELLRLFGDKK